MRARHDHTESRLATMYAWFQNALVPLLVGVLLVAATGLLLSRLEDNVYDLFSRWSAKPATGSPVVLVLIDDASVSRLSPVFGPMPWSRTAYVEIFKRISAGQPAAIVFDGHFPEHRRAEDEAVFTAMKNIPNLITGIANNDGVTDTSLNPENAAYYQLNLGLVNVVPSEDGVIRAVKPVDKADYFPGVAGTLPSLSTAAAMAYLNHHGGDGTFAIQNHTLALSPERATPLDEHNHLWLRWSNLLADDGSGIRQSHESVSAWRLFEADFTAEDYFEHKIVMIGSSASMFRDYHPTPMNQRHLGTDIHATAVDNLLAGEGHRRLPEGFGFILAMAGFVLAMLLRLLVLQSGRAVLYVSGLVVGYIWLSFFLFSQPQGLVLPVLTPVFGMMVGFLMASMWGLGMRERQVALLERNLAQLVSASVLEEIRRRRHSIEPGGQRMEITSMFVDIRNFTAQAEHLPSAELTAMLNAFYARVVDIVFKYEGTIDKFMGDGILVMFGAPIPDARHREKALACAMEILDSMSDESMPEDIGISMASGMAFVGFVGPKHKLEYTAVGDVVNLCVRLQDFTKQYDTRLIVADSTAHPFSDEAKKETGWISLKRLDTVTVRGREAAIAIYTLD